jgi:hypothetical protein
MKKLNYWRTFAATAVGVLAAMAAILLASFAVAPHPAKADSPDHLQLISIKCYETEDAIHSTDEIDLLVNGTVVWSNHAFTAGEEFDISGLPSIPFNGTAAIQLIDRDNPGFPWYDDDDDLGTRPVTYTGDERNLATFSDDEPAYYELYYRVVRPDYVAPETWITSGPSGLVNTRDATFELASNEPGVQFYGALDAEGFVPIAPSKTYTELADGEHIFKAYAVDAAGNIGSTSASRTWTVDATKPLGTVLINGGGQYSNDPSVELSLSATDPGTGSGVVLMRFSNNGSTWSEWGAYATIKAWSLSSANGTKTVYAQFSDGAGNLSDVAKDTIVLDTQKPMVVAISPANGTTGVARGINVAATFSEKMQSATVKSSFKLYKAGATTPISASVNYDAVSRKATLNPYGTSTTLLAKKTRYKAVVTTAVKDLAGNTMATQEVWYFTTRS